MNIEGRLTHGNVQDQHHTRVLDAPDVHLFWTGHRAITDQRDSSWICKTITYLLVTLVEKKTKQMCPFFTSPIFDMQSTHLPLCLPENGDSIDEIAAAFEYASVAELAHLGAEVTAMVALV